MTRDVRPGSRSCPTPRPPTPCPAGVAARTGGAAAAALAGRLQADGTDLLPGLARLRAEVGAEHAGPAWELARLRARARPVFGADADVLFLTADALEQAGRPELAARRAARLLAGGAARAADLGCAAGTDAIALARAGASVARRRPRPDRPGADRGERRGARRRRPGRGRSTPTSSTWSPRPTARSRAAPRPPSTRRGGPAGRRQLDPDRWSPPWSTVATLLDRVPTSVVKVAPGPRPRPRARRRGGRVGVGRRIDRRGAALGSRAVGDLAPGDRRARRRRPRAHRGRRPRTGRRRAGARRGCTSPIPPSSARASCRWSAADLGAHADRPDDRLPDLRRRRRLAVGQLVPRRRGAAVQPEEAQGPAAGARRRAGRRQEARLTDRARDARPAAERPRERLRRRRRHPGGRRARPCWCMRAGSARQPPLSG